MGGWAAFLDWLKSAIENNIPAIATWFWNYEESRVDQAKSDTERVQTQLQVEKNHEAVDQQNSGKSDADVISDAIKNNGGGNSTDS